MPTEAFIDEVAVGAHAFGSFIGGNIEADETLVLASLKMPVVAQTDIELGETASVLRRMPVSVQTAIELGETASVKHTMQLTAETAIELIQGASVIGPDVCVLDIIISTTNSKLKKNLLIKNKI